MFKLVMMRQKRKKIVRRKQVDRTDGVIFVSRSNQVSLLFLRKYECKTVLSILYVTLMQCFPAFLMPRTPCSECYFTAAPIKSKMKISCSLHTYDKNEVINHNFTTLNVSSMTMQYCINGDFRMNMNISVRPNIMNLTLT
jgi:hypothetical protein